MRFLWLWVAIVVLVALAFTGRSLRQQNGRSAAHGNAVSEESPSFDDQARQVAKLEQALSRQTTLVERLKAQQNSSSGSRGQQFGPTPVQRLESQIDDSRSALAGLEVEMQLQNDQSYAGGAVTDQSIATSADQQLAVDSLNSQIASEQTAINDLESKVRQYEETNIETEELDEMRNDLAAERARLDGLFGARAQVLAEAKADQEQATEERQAENRASLAASQQLQARYQQELGHYNELQRRYEELTSREPASVPNNAPATPSAAEARYQAAEFELHALEDQYHEALDRLEELENSGGR